LLSLLSLILIRHVLQPDKEAFFRDDQTTKQIS